MKKSLVALATAAALLVASAGATAASAAPDRRPVPRVTVQRILDID